MTQQYLPESINYGPEAAFVQSTSLDGANQQGSDANNDTVFQFTNVTNSSANHYTVTSSNALGTTVTILQPGVYVAELVAAIAAGAQALAVSLGGTANSFGATPAAIGTAAGNIALAVDADANASVMPLSISFRVAPGDIDGTSNVVRFLGTANGVWVATQVRMRIDRVLASS